MKYSILIILASLFYTCAYIVKDEKKSKTNTIEPRKFNDRKQFGFEDLLDRDDKYVLKPPAPRRSQFRTLMSAYHEKWQIAINLGIWFSSQAGIKNKDWEASSIKFLNYINANNFSAFICAVNRNLTFVEFYNYLNEKRQKNLNTNASLSLGFQEPSHDNDYIIIITYNLVSKFGYVVEEKWRLNLTLMNDQKYRIYKMEQYNGCLGYGEEKNVTVVDITMDTIVPRLIAMHFYTALTDRFHILDRWILLMDNTTSFTASVCGKNISYSTEEFLIYMEYFIRRWRFPVEPDKFKTEPHLFELITSSADTYIFQYVLSPLLDISVSETISEDWVIRAQVKLNEHGDGQWKINRVDLTCPIERESKNQLLVNYGKQVVYDIGKGMESLVQNVGEWYYSLDFLMKYSPLTKNVTTKIDVCDMPENSEYTYVLWKLHSNWTNKLLKVNTIKWDEIEYTDESFSFDLKLKTISLELDAYYTLDWKYEFHLYPKYAIFELRQLTVGCQIRHEHKKAPKPTG